MKDFTRRTIVAALGATLSGRPVVSVYDYARKQAFSYSAEAEENLINGFDHDRGHHIAGSIEKDTIQLYDSGLEKRITIFVRGVAFSGYDYDTRTYFSGTVEGDSINLVDHENGINYRFLI